VRHIAGVLACAYLFHLSAAPLSPAQAPGPLPQTNVLEGHRLYYTGDHPKALENYLKAVRADPKNLEAWVNGAIVQAEIGDARRSAEWFAEALELAPQDQEVRTALAEAEFRLGRATRTLEVLDAFISNAPPDPYAFIARGRAWLTLGEPRKAAAALETAAETAPELSLAHYWLGKARETAGDRDGSIEAYRRAVQKDSYFTTARYQLGRAYLRSNRFYEAWKQVMHLQDSDPRNRKFRGMLAGVSKRAIESSRPEPEDAPRPNGGAPKTSAEAEPLGPPLPPVGRLPVLRVGLGTSGLGKPLPRRELAFRCTRAFNIIEGKTGKLLVSGPRGETWKIRPGKKASRIEIFDENGHRRAVSSRSLRIRPDAASGGVTVLRDVPADYGSSSRGGGDRPLRGEIEVALMRRGLSLVNVVDLESYTHGVLASEMPIGSPMEALKAQAVVARSHALFIKTVTKRHARDGFDICDGQHCQVYWGVRNENARSRAVVEATRGRVAAYGGRIAHVLYASNCGGHTQSGKELQGWGDVPYWKGVLDAPGAIERPYSPWTLRLWLRSRPSAFCRGSSYVHPSHFRWTRVITAEDLEEHINRTLKVGKLLAVRTLTRSRSGHLNAVAVRGSKATKVVTKEIAIRGLLGDGSQRSGLFVVDTEYGKDGKPKVFTFYGGGWGHGVGMCQSGAMGRAEYGQTYAEILQAYYPGTELGNLRY
jgi:SpoIID/LytB domain protein